MTNAPPLLADHQRFFLQATVLPYIVADHPSIFYSLEGAQAEQRESLGGTFLIPMAVSLAFGVLFATFITLLLVPAGYAIIEDIKTALANMASRVRGRDTAGTTVEG